MSFRIKSGITDSIYAQALGNKLCDTPWMVSDPLESDAPRSVLLGHPL